MYNEEDIVLDFPVVVKLWAGQGTWAIKYDSTSQYIFTAST
jgi:hypothetical protein